LETVQVMSANDTLNRIREAEEKAAEIRTNAKEAVGMIISDGRKAAQERYEAAVADAKKEKKEALDSINAKAENIINEERKDAVFEAERLKNRAVRYGDEAVKFICLEIDKKCQS